jgi:hypothetical protein
MRMSQLRNRIAQQRDGIAQRVNGIAQRRNESNRIGQRGRVWQEKSVTNIDQSKLGHLYLFQSALLDSLTVQVWMRSTVVVCPWPCCHTPLSKRGEAYETAGRLLFSSADPITFRNLETLRNIAILTLFQRPFYGPILQIDPLYSQETRLLFATN